MMKQSVNRDLVFISSVAGRVEVLQKIHGSREPLLAVEELVPRAGEHGAARHGVVIVDRRLHIK